MADVRLHPSSTEQFIDRLHTAFVEGDGAWQAKTREARNVSRLQEQYRALARGEISPALAMMEDNVEMELFTPADLPIAGYWRGLAEVAVAMQRNFGRLADQQAEILSVVAQGDMVVLYANEVGKIRATGNTYRIRWAQIFTFRGDKIARITGVAAALS